MMQVCHKHMISLSLKDNMKGKNFNDEQLK